MYCHANLWQQSPELEVALKNPIKNTSSQQHGKTTQKTLPILAMSKRKCCIHTRGGNVFSAALRGTENPPWVLVSLAVRVLQKNSVGCWFCLRPMSEASIASLSYYRTGNTKQFSISHTLLISVDVKRMVGNAYQQNYQIEQLTYFIYRLKGHLCIYLIGFGVSLIRK